MAVTTVDEPAKRASTRRLRLSFASKALLAFLLPFMGLHLVLGIVGAAAVVVLALVFALYHLHTGRLLVQPYLLGFAAVGLLYMALSAAHLLPVPEFGRQFPDYITRTGYFAPLLLPLVSGMYFLWKEIIEKGREDAVFLACLATFFVIDPTAIFVAAQYVPPIAVPILLGVDHNNAIEFFRFYWFYGPDNKTIPLIMAGAWFLHKPVRTHFQNWIAVMIFVLFAASLASVQMVVVLLLFFVYKILRSPGLFVRVSSWFFVLVPPIVGFLYVEYGISNLNTADPLNTADSTGKLQDMIARTMWWHDTLVGWVQTGFLGGGFGADSVRYSFRSFINAAKTDILPIIVPHNDFVYIAYSMGFMGIILFAGFYLSLAHRLRHIPNWRERGHLAFLLTVLIIAHSINSAISSPRFIVGIAFCLGYILVRLERAEHGLSSPWSKFAVRSPRKVRAVGLPDEQSMGLVS